MRFAVCVAMGIGLSIPFSARAECEQPYSSAKMGEDLASLGSALRSRDDDTLKSAGQRLDAGIGCLDAPLPPPVFASAFRYLGVYHHRFGDRERAREWFVSGLELDSSFEWDVAEMPPTDPLRSVFDELRGQAESEPTAVAGVELVVPDGSALRLDGRPLTVAAATTGRPHVLQVVNQSDSQQAQSLLIEGNALPERFLQVIAVAEATTSDKKRRSERNEHTPTDDLSVVTVRRVRPAAKTPLMVSGAVLMLGAGGIYGASFGTRAKFDAATTTADLERYRNLTNTLVVASAATLAAGLSVEYAGVLLGAGPGGARVGWSRSF